MPRQEAFVVTCPRDDLPSVGDYVRVERSPISANEHMWLLVSGSGQQHVSGKLLLDGTVVDMASLEGSVSEVKELVEPEMGEAEGRFSILVDLASDADRDPTPS